MKNNKIMMILSILAIITLIGCTQPTVPGSDIGTYSPEELFNPEEDITSQTFSSITELKNFIDSHEGSNNNGMQYRGALFESVSFDASESAPTAKLTTGGSIDYSQTNNQVADVDEADIIKTDGNYIYSVDKKTVYIIEAGNDAEILSKIKLNNNPTSIFIFEDTLVVFGNLYDDVFFKEIDYTPRSGMTYLNIYDVSDRENPELIKDYKFDGNYFQGRMVGNFAYIVTTTSPYGPMPMPVFYDGVIRHEIGINKIHYFNIPYDNPQFANIHAINLKNPGKINSESVVVEGSRNMYMSKNNMYITNTEYINEWELRQDLMRELVEPLLPAGDRLIIEKIKNTDNEVLSQTEKEQKIIQIISNYVAYMGPEEQEQLEDELETLVEEELEKYDYMEYTIIHKISVDDENIIVGDTGKVPGHVVNQFSMDEFENIFRIATTTNARWSSFDKERSESLNHIFTLDEDLDILDHLEGLAEGERIYSTRFIEDRLYMVTFRQVDPFFVIDLSNPGNIKELGELKIPGFSRYLHPYDDNHIIGIGQEANERGRTEGLKISLFDVEDVENPKEVAKFVTEGKYSSSIAEYEHKAFLFSLEKNLLVIPAYSYDWQSKDGYNGAMVFDITEDEIELRGLIDHSKGEQRYGSSVERSLYIEDNLYTKSSGLLRINNLDTLEGVKDLELENNDAPYKVY